MPTSQITNTFFVFVSNKHKLRYDTAPVPVNASAVVFILELTHHHSYYCHGFTLEQVFSRWSTVRDTYPLVWLDDISMMSPALLNDC
jgi:hypothetical protein